MCRGKICTVLRMVVLVLLLLALFPHMVCKARTVQCSMVYPHSPLHTYHQSGDLIIGGVAYHAGIVTSLLPFEEEPLPVLMEPIV